MAKFTEKQLVQRCIKEDRSAQQEVFRRYGGKLLSVCRRYARHRLEAEDLLQDAFIKIFDKMHTFKHKGSLEGWMRRITVNIAIKNYKLSKIMSDS